MAEKILQIAKYIPTPAFVADVRKLKRNLRVADRIRKEAGCKILLATKAFAMPAVYPLMRQYLDGTTASGLYEARHDRHEFDKEVHAYCPAYKDSEIDELVKLADYVYFNSPEQMKLYGAKVKKAGKKIGVRINPGYSKSNIGGDLYNPCAPCSRFGALPKDLDKFPWKDIDLLHAHVLCESLHEGSVGLIEHIAKHFGKYVEKVKAVNFGGGHFFNKPGYDVGALIKAIRKFKRQFPHVEVILEPGGALVYDAGYLVASVLDTPFNREYTAVLDISATCHAPDIITAHFRPPVLGAVLCENDDGERTKPPKSHQHGYILAGRTCMTGDIISMYGFKKPLRRGDRIVLSDMMQYNFVQNTTFNGTPLPDLFVMQEDGKVLRASNFGYDEFARRLGVSAKKLKPVKA